MYVTCVNAACGSDNIKYLIPPASGELFCEACGEHFTLAQVESKIIEDVFFDKAIKEVDWPGYLEHGKLYDCLMAFTDALEKDSIIPLARDPNSFKRFVMMDARSLFTENPEYIEEIAKMTFNEILNEGISDQYPFHYDTNTIILRPFSDGTLAEDKVRIKFLHFIDSNLR